MTEDFFENGCKVSNVEIVDGTIFGSGHSICQLDTVAYSCSVSRGVPDFRLQKSSKTPKGAYESRRQTLLRRGEINFLAVENRRTPRQRVLAYISVERKCGAQKLSELDPAPISATLSECFSMTHHVPTGPTITKEPWFGLSGEALKHHRTSRE
jgi:hypothetical protein